MHILLGYTVFKQASALLFAATAFFFFFPFLYACKSTFMFGYAHTGIYRSIWREMFYRQKKMHRRRILRGAFEQEKRSCPSKHVSHVNVYPSGQNKSIFWLVECIYSQMPFMHTYCNIRGIFIAKFCQKKIIFISPCA